MTATSNEEQIDGHQLLNSRALDPVTRATFPIYFAVAGGELQFDRTAVLIRLAGEYFFLTAIHELKSLQRGDVRAFTRPADGNSAPVDITAHRIIALGDPADVGVIRLEPSVHARLKASDNALTSKDLDISPEWDETTPFIICGFPKIWEGQSMSLSGPIRVPRLMSLLTHGYEGETEKPDQFSRDAHISVLWSKNFQPSVVGGKIIEPSSEFAATPKPKGISGGGIWRTGLRNPTVPGPRYACKLSAIQHTVNRDQQYAIGTKVCLALYLIWKGFPELQPLIEKELPRTFPTHSALNDQSS